MNEQIGPPPPPPPPPLPIATKNHLVVSCNLQKNQTTYGIVDLDDTDSKKKDWDIIFHTKQTVDKLYYPTYINLNINGMYISIHMRVYNSLHRYTCGSTKINLKLDKENEPIRLSLSIVNANIIANQIDTQLLAETKDWIYHDNVGSNAMMLLETNSSYSIQYIASRNCIMRDDDIVYELDTVVKDQFEEWYQKNTSFDTEEQELIQSTTSSLRISNDSDNVSVYIPQEDNTASASGKIRMLFTKNKK